MTPYDYFKMFITLEIIDCVVEQTNLYSFKKNHKRINTHVPENSALIDTFIKMDVILLPS